MRSKCLCSKRYLYVGVSCSKNRAVHAYFNLKYIYFSVCFQHATLFCDDCRHEEDNLYERKAEAPVPRIVFGSHSELAFQLR